MPLLGSIAKALGSALAKRATSGGSKSSSGGTSQTIGSHTYSKDSSGRVYKNGNLVAPENYKYVPSSFLNYNAGNGNTGNYTQTIGSHTYSKDGSGNIYKNGNLVAPENYKYVPSSFLSSSGQSNTDLLSGIGNVIGKVSNVVGDTLTRGASDFVTALKDMPAPAESPVQYYVPEIPYNNELASIIGELSDLSSQSYDAGSAALISKAYDDTIAQIDAAQAELMKQMNDQMSGVDPATMAALKVIRDSVEQNRQNLMEEMNRRGLLQSGIWLEQENKLNSAQANAEQNLLATRLQDLQSQLNQALSNFGTMRVNAASNKGMQELQAIENEAARKQSAIQAGLQAALNLYNYNQQYAKDMMPYYMQTVDELRDDNRAYEELYGESVDWNGLSGSPSPELVSVREYASTYPGAKVEWDKNTQSVIVNGQRIEAPSIQGGRAYVNKATLDRILGGR